MLNRLKKINATDLLITFLSCWTLVFFLSPFKVVPWGTAYRYLIYVAAPILFLIIITKIWNKVYFKGFIKNLYKFIIPFIPFLICYIITFLYHIKTGFNPYIKLNVICLIIVINSLLFAVLSIAGKQPSPKIFFISSSLATLIFFGDCVYTSIVNSADPFAIRPFVKPYATIYGHCIALISGLCLIGVFYPDNYSKKLRIFFLASAFLGFFAALGMLAVRATILVPFFALFTSFCIIKPKRKIYKTFLFSISILSLVSLFFLSPMEGKMMKGIDEVRSVLLTTDISSTISKINSQQPLTEEEEALKSSLNTSMGARVAVWTIAKDLTKGKEVFGTGDGQPADFVDVKKVFSYSQDYLPHFHSDYVQLFVIGGLVLVIGLVCTQLLLLYEGLFSPLKLYLALTIISFGVIDLGFCDLRGFTCFMGAWLIVSLWDKNRQLNN